MLHVHAHLNKLYLFFVCENLKVVRNLANSVYIYLARKLCFWTSIIFIGVYVSVCVSVSESLYQLSQKVLDRFL